MIKSTVTAAEYVAALIERSSKAQKIVEKYSQKKVDELVASIAWSTVKEENAKEIAQKAMEESLPCKHEWTRKSGSWWYECKKCDEREFLGLGGLNKVCHSHNQKECLLETAKLGRMDPDMCVDCPDFY